MCCVLSLVEFLLVFGLFVCNVCTLCLLFCLFVTKVLTLLIEGMLVSDTNMCVSDTDTTHVITFNYVIFSNY
jgi:hypothetical protein